MAQGTERAASGYRRIATEEAFVTDDVVKEWRKLLDARALDDPGFYSLSGYYLNDDSERAVAVRSRLADLGQRRLQDMDDTGIAMQVLSLTAPGVQVFDAATAVSLAASVNDQLAEAVCRHPERYAGLAAVAPQEPSQAAKELERAVTDLGLKGAVINSHTKGEYLDDEKFWDIFEAAEALSVPIYIHPVTPSPAMIGPFLDRGLDGAIYGFAVETSVHALRMIIAGVFDRFPDLKIVLGHLGEGLPFWLYRLDYMHGAIVNANRYEGVKPTKKRLSEYLKENFYFTTSGMPWEPAILFTRSVIGRNRVMYAMDYPYQFNGYEVEMTDNLALSPAELREFYESIATRVFSL